MKYRLLFVLTLIFCCLGKTTVAQVSDSIPDIKIKEPPVIYPNPYRSDPVYPGGFEKLTKYIDSAIVYPKRALRRKIGGRVIVGFVIEADGHIDELKAYRSPDEELSKECIRALKDLVFIPAKYMNGKGVRTMYTVPVNFDPEHPKDHRYHPPSWK
jgi:TonB family protein